MKIVSYNIAQYSQRKIDVLLNRGADVYIIPEIHSSKEIVLPAEYELFRFSDPKSSNKGLGVICRKSLAFYLPDWFKDEHKYILPVCSGNLVILAMWPTRVADNKSKGYPQIALEALHYYAQYFKGKRVIVIGDFNCFIGQKDESLSRGTLLQIVEFLSSFDIYSLYHKHSNEVFGQESVATYHWRFCEERRYFIDYAFTNIRDAQYTLGNWDSAFSDHHAQIVEL